jgi:hypothetical protein
MDPGAELVTNGWHGKDLHVGVRAKDCAQAVALHPDRTLFLSWPAHGQDVGARILMAYKGNRVIYVGDAHGGDQMHRILDTDWTEVDARQPVQWWGQHDRVTVHERGQPDG